MTTEIGFGCASLGSRVSRRDGLAALAKAYEAGIRWYDVAPSYGDGEAETLLGQFSADRRDAIILCTKVGILPPAPSVPKRLLRPVVRAALSAVPGLRQTVRRHRPAASKPPLDATRILPSLDASLKRLRTDYVDVLALHEATPDEVTRDDILRAIEIVLASGKARTISIASSTEAALAGIAGSPLYGVVQLANNPFQPLRGRVAAALPPDRDIRIVTHTVFGASGMVERLTARIRNDAVLAGALADAGYTGSLRGQALAYLADYALAANDGGTVLMSMFGAGHLEANLTRLKRMPDETTILAIAAQIPADAGA
ncbi:aldo/keto reductase [Novosphingobium sp. B-7]|uniref:aldo/keto reductase n=1 Tax=Novosphingobium sp. B-7 TaxID=1298855 RepID=UPI0003B59857|nr:aldo/keto reductase [Novosphingobium sp. B-7]